MSWICSECRHDNHRECKGTVGGDTCACPHPKATDCDLCGDNEGPKFLHARCHMTAPLQASLEDGVLTLRCYIPGCQRVVARLRVTEVLK